MKINIIYVVIIILSTISVVRGQDTTEELKKSDEKWWNQYATALKEVRGEKNDHQASVLINKITVELIPQFANLIAVSEKWKSRHSPAEIQAMKNWAEGNPVYAEVSSLQTDPNILIRTGRSREFAQAYGEMMKAMLKTGRK